MTDQTVTTMSGAVAPSRLPATLAGLLGVAPEAAVAIAGLISRIEALEKLAAASPARPVAPSIDPDDVAAAAFADAHARFAAADVHPGFVLALEEFLISAAPYLLGGAELAASFAPGGSAVVGILAIVEKALPIVLPRVKAALEKETAR